MEAGASMADDARTDDQSLRDAWDSVATDWAAWARKPGHDSYWRFHRAAFFALIPRPVA